LQQQSSDVDAGLFVFEDDGEEERGLVVEDLVGSVYNVPALLVLVSG